MISDKYRCIFVHVPKAAGQSVESFFLNLHGLAWKDRAPLLLRHNPDPARGPQRLAHLTAREYVDCGHITREDFNAYFKFSFTRNPWARLVSEYQYRNLDGTLSFRDFLLGGLPAKSNYTDAYRHIIPQYDFLHDEAGNLLVDFVGKFEQLQVDFDCVCSRLGIADSTLPHANASAGKGPKRPHYTAYYDPETEEVVRQMYRKDIETFQYRFGS